MSRLLLMAMLLMAGCAQQDVVEAPQLGEYEKAAIAERIFVNECAGRASCLTSWNKGEEFASLGIGHFIWYPSGTSAEEKRFSESFPALVRFMQSKGAIAPAWFRADSGCPWVDRASFVEDLNGQKLSELRTWLMQTMPLQADFMAKRLTQVMPKMLGSAPEEQRSHIRRQFERVGASPMGMYALMDYVNFKGEGINPKERYDGQGWGMLQVLGLMRGERAGVKAVSEFADTAYILLTRRVAHAPEARHEERWLPGWRKRLQTYTQEAGRLKN
jgi:hypothetical protein